MCIRDRNSDYIEGTRNQRSLDGQAAVEDENSITSVISGSGKCKHFTARINKIRKTW